MSYVSYFSADYSSARGRFIELAARKGFRLESYPIDAHDPRGPNGETLTMDVALLGSTDPQRVVIVSSGMHGVEGFFGSAAQLAWLSTRGAGWAPPPDGAFILVHAINPFGFAWRRRWNEGNVDLNRNFLSDFGLIVSDPSYQESSRTYQRLNAFLNPASPPSRFEPYTLKALLLMLSQGISARGKMPVKERPKAWAPGKLIKLGLGEFQKTLPVGQYYHQQGLFYGGRGPEQSTKVLQEQMPAWVRNAKSMIHLDFHTGLGAWGVYKLLIADEQSTHRAQWITARFGADHVEPWNGRTAYQARGTMPDYFKRRFAERNYHCLTAEFGTYKPMPVLGALRAENRAHFYGKPGEPLYERAKQQVMEVFCPASTEWREQAVDQGLKLIAQAERHYFES